MALLHLAARSSLVENTGLCVFTVDHRMRAASAQEAEFVGGVCQRLGISHQTLIWDEPNASQTRARSARHRLLATALKEAGGRLLLTGHTLSDNVESFLIRARAASGWYGLAGMGALTASPVWPEGEGVFVARPMLGMQRDDVREWLKAAQQEWCDDPSNENHKYERVRMRSLLAETRVSQRIDRIQEKLKRLRAARDAELAHWLGTAHSEDNGVELPFPDEMKQEAFSQGLSLLCMATAGSDRPARRQRCLAAAQKLQASSDQITLTLGGAVIQKRENQLKLHIETNRQTNGAAAQARLRLQHICAGLTGSNAQ